MKLLSEKQLRNLKVSQLEEIKAEMLHVLAQHKAALKETTSHSDYVHFKKLQRYHDQVKSVLKHKINTHQD
ncbi:hypothetical protein NCTGTJJY_CDS0107 [Serratia phage 92A1]|nr:hypothetical protein NCTGTJJY_CDS0107 [Serratia phage 92A1]